MFGIEVENIDHEQIGCRIRSVGSSWCGVFSWKTAQKHTKIRRVQVETQNHSSRQLPTMQSNKLCTGKVFVTAAEGPRRAGIKIFPWTYCFCTLALCISVENTFLIWCKETLAKRNSGTAKWACHSGSLFREAKQLGDVFVQTHTYIFCQIILVFANPVKWRYFEALVWIETFTSLCFVSLQQTSSFILMTSFSPCVLVPKAAQQGHAPCM